MAAGKLEKGAGLKELMGKRKKESVETHSYQAVARIDPEGAEGVEAAVGVP